MSRACQLITHLQLFTGKEMSVKDEPIYVVVGLQLLEMNSITTLNQTILNVCTRCIFRIVLFLGKILAILAICDNEKNAVR